MEFKDSAISKSKRVDRMIVNSLDLNISVFSEFPATRMDITDNDAAHSFQMRQHFDAVSECRR